MHVLYTLHLSIIPSNFPNADMFVALDYNIPKIHLRSKLRIPKSTEIFRVSAILSFYITQKYYSEKPVYF